MKNIKKLFCLFITFLMFSCSSIPNNFNKSGIEILFLSCDDCNSNVLDISVQNRIETYTIYANNDYVFSINLIENNKEKEIEKVEFIKDSSVTIRMYFEDTFIVNCKNAADENRLTIKVGEYSKEINLKVIENNTLSFSKELWDESSNYNKSNLISSFLKENEIVGMHKNTIESLLGKPDIEMIIQECIYPPIYGGGEFIYNLGDYIGESYYFKIFISGSYMVYDYELSYCSLTKTKRIKSKMPTCLEEGYIYYGCEICAKVFEIEKIEKVECSFDENNACIWCGFYNHDDNLNKDEHIQVVESYKEPTCLEEGYIIYGCSSCDEKANYYKHFDKVLCSYNEDDLCIWCGGEKPIVKYINTFKDLEGNANIVNSVEELEDLYLKHYPNRVDKMEIDELFDYDEEYFSLNSLVLLVLKDNFNDLNFEVKKVEVLNGQINISILNGISTDPYPLEGTWIVAIEVHQKIPSDYNINIISKSKVLFK